MKEELHETIETEETATPERRLKKGKKHKILLIGIIAVLLIVAYVLFADDASRVLKGAIDEVSMPSQEMSTVEFDFTAPRNAIVVKDAPSGLVTIETERGEVLDLRAVEGERVSVAESSTSSITYYYDDGVWYMTVFDEAENAEGTPRRITPRANTTSGAPIFATQIDANTKRFVSVIALRNDAFVIVEGSEELASVEWVDALKKSIRLK